MQMDSHLKGTRDAHCTSVRWGGEIQKVQDKQKEEVTCGGYRTCGPITIIGCTSDTPLIHPFHPNLEAAIEDLKGGHLERNFATTGHACGRIFVMAYEFSAVSERCEDQISGPWNGALALSCQTTAT
ncbi:hypothetical protein V8E53_008045 [Lactarius tabidus]